MYKRIPNGLVHILGHVDSDAEIAVEEYPSEIIPQLHHDRIEVSARLQSGFEHSFILTYRNVDRDRQKLYKHKANEHDYQEGHDSQAQSLQNVLKHVHSITSF